MTVRTHALPQYFGVVSATVKASSDEAYRRLIGKTVEFYREALFNPHWGEQIKFGGGLVDFQMVFQGLDQQQAEAVWRTFSDWVSASPHDFSFNRRRGFLSCRRRGICGTPSCSSSLRAS